MRSKGGSWNSHLMRLQTRDRKTERQPTFHRLNSAHLRTDSQGTPAHSQPTFLVNWQTYPCSQPTCLLWMCKTHYLLSTNFTSVNHTGLLSLWWNSKHFSNQLSSLANWGVFLKVSHAGKDLGYLYCIFSWKGIIMLYYIIQKYIILHILIHVTGFTESSHFNSSIIG